MKLIKLAVAGSAAAAGAFAARKKIDTLKSTPEGKKLLADCGNNAVYKVVDALASLRSDKSYPFINRYEPSDLMEGSGYFLDKPAKNAAWSWGYSKASVVPLEMDGDFYIGGYLAFPPNKLTGIINEQMIRCAAIDDGSGRGINVFAVIDCVGLSRPDIDDIRTRLGDFAGGNNIVSVNISATHCHSGIDTVGLWGDLVTALKKNPKALKKNRPEELVSGKNPVFMEYLKETSVRVIKEAVSSMSKGELSYARMDVADLVRDKRPPYVKDDFATVLKFTKEGEKPLYAVMMASHPVCYGDKQTAAVCDFPRYMCDRFEQLGFDAAFIQGAELAIASERGHISPVGDEDDAGIRGYGEEIANRALAITAFTPLKPLINVAIKEVFLPVDNPILKLAAKFGVVANSPVRFAFSNDKKPKKNEVSLLFPTRTGFAVLGEKQLSLVMVPGELAPELLLGGTNGREESYTGQDWTLPPIKDIMGTDTAVIGLCNDFVGYIIPDNDFGSVFAELHYEESCSVGPKTASNLVNALINLKKKTDESVPPFPDTMTED